MDSLETRTRPNSSSSIHSQLYFVRECLQYCSLGKFIQFPMGRTLALPRTACTKMVCLSFQIYFVCGLHIYTAARAPDKDQLAMNDAAGTESLYQSVENRESRVRYVQSSEVNWSAPRVCGTHKPLSTCRQGLCTIIVSTVHLCTTAQRLGVLVRQTYSKTKREQDSPVCIFGRKVLY